MKLTPRASRKAKTKATTRATGKATIKGVRKARATLIAHKPAPNATVSLTVIPAARYVTAGQTEATTGEDIRTAVAPAGVEAEVGIAAANARVVLSGAALIVALNYASNNCS
jgi:hypothetical protein